MSSWLINVPPLSPRLSNDRSLMPNDVGSGESGLANPPRERKGLWLLKKSIFLRNSQELRDAKCLEKRESRL